MRLVGDLVQAFTQKLDATTTQQFKRIAPWVLAVLVKDSDWLLENLHVTPIENNEIVLPKGHNVNFGAPVGTMVALGGGKLVEAGYANECSAQQLAAAITPRTAAILYIKSHHCVQKSMLNVAQAAEVARQHGADRQCGRFEGDGGTQFWTFGGTVGRSDVGGVTAFSSCLWPAPITRCRRWLRTTPAVCLSSWITSG